VIYTYKNVAYRATVYEVGSKSDIDHVESIDTDIGEVKVALHPFCLDGNGEIATETIRFKAIHPIGGTTFYSPISGHCQIHFPCLFLCFGRLP